MRCIRSRLTSPSRLRSFGALALRFSGFSIEWPGEPLVPPFLFGPGLLTLVLILTDVLAPLPPEWGLRYLGTIEIYAACSAGYLLYAQNLTTSPVRSNHEFWRLRTILWGLLSTSVTGEVLTVFRGYPEVPLALIPPSQYPTTELGALALTIAILAMLARYTVMTSKADTADVATALREVAETVGSGFAALASKMGEFLDSRRSEVGETRERGERTLRVRVYIAKAGWLHNSARVDVVAGPEGLASAEVRVGQSEQQGVGHTVQILGRANLGSTPPGSGVTIDLGDVSRLFAVSHILVDARWVSLSNRRYIATVVFTYLRQGIFSFRVDPGFLVDVVGTRESP